MTWLLYVTETDAFRASSRVFQEETNVIPHADTPFFRWPLLE